MPGGGSTSKIPTTNRHRRASSMREAQRGSPFFTKQSSKKINAVNSWAPSRFAAEEERRTTRSCWLPLPTSSTPWNVAALVCGLIVTLASVVRTGVTPHAPEGGIGIVWCGSRLTCAPTMLTKCLLVIAKLSAGAIYVVLAFAFATMAHSTATYLGKKPQIVVSENGLFGTSHSREAHFRGGRAVAVLGLVHTAAHLCRYAANGELAWALSVPMVLAGLVAAGLFALVSPSGARKKLVEALLQPLWWTCFSCCCFFCFGGRRRGVGGGGVGGTKTADRVVVDKGLLKGRRPGVRMTKPRRHRRLKLSYETWMVVSHHFAAASALVAGAVHHPRFAVAILLICVLWGLDRVYLKLCRTYLVEAPHFVAVADDDGDDDAPAGAAASSEDGERPSGTLVAFANPPGFDYETGDFVKIRFPWLAGPLGAQEHPFSLAPIGRKDKNRSMLYVAVYGDWTTALWNTVRRCGNGFGRPMLIVGPYSAPFNTSFTHNFVFIVASGVGITPILSVVERFGATRHIVVLWICRDAALLRLYADYLHTRRCHAHVYYTGDVRNATDVRELQNDVKPLTVRVGRPDVRTIANAVLTCTPLAFGDDDHKSNNTQEAAGPARRQQQNDDLEIGAIPAIPEDDGDEPPHVDDLDDDHRHPGKRSFHSIWTPPRPPSFTRQSARRSSAVPRLNTKEVTSARCLDEQPIAAHEWRVLYCGGSRAISDVLHDVCSELGASYSCESFWL